MPFDRSIYDLEEEPKSNLVQGFDISPYDMRTPEVQLAEMNYNAVAELGINPDQEAKDYETAKKGGFPISAVRLNREVAERNANKPNFDHLMNISPGLGSFYQRPENMAVSFDDSENLSIMEKAAKKILGTFDALVKVPIRTVPVMAESVDRGVSLIGGVIEVTGKFLHETNSDFMKMSGISQLVFGSVERAGSWLKNWGKDNADGIRTDILNSPQLNLPEELRGRLIDNPQYIVDPEWLVTNIGEAANSMAGVMAAYSVGGLPAAAATGGLMEAGPAYNDMLENPDIKHENALTAAMSFGFVSGYLNKIGLGTLLQKVPTGTVLKRVAHRLATGGTEAFTEWLEEPVEAIAKGMAAGDDFPTLLSKVADSMKNIDVIPGSFVLGASGVVAKTQADYRVKAEEYEANMLDLAEKANATLLKGRSEAKLKEAIEAVGVNQDVFMSASDALYMFQNKREDMEQFIRKTGLNLDEIQEAITEGRDIAIPASSMLAFTENEFQSEIIKRTKGSPETLSMSEIQETDIESINEQVAAIEQEKEAVEAEIERISREAKNARVSDKTTQATLAIFKSMSENLVKLGTDQVDFLKRVKIVYKPIRSIQYDERELYARGRLIPTEDFEYYTVLFEDKNESTIIHEFSHVYMRELDRLRTQNLLSEEGIKTVEFIDEWLGGTSIETLSVEKDEEFAQSFEQYLKYGEAPTKSLRKPFALFKKWLTDIYKNHDFELKPEVKTFFDQMLSDDIAIEASAASNGMIAKPAEFLNTLQISQEDKLYLRELLKGAKLEASDLMKYDRDSQKKELRKEWKEQATKEIEEQKVYAAIDNIKANKLDEEIMFETYGPEIKSLLPRGLLQKDGKDPNASAFENNYEDIDDMVSALMEADPKAKVIKEREQLYEATHDSKFNADEYLSFTTQYSDYLEIIDKYVARSGDQQIKSKPAKAYAEKAQRNISSMTMKNATAYTRFLSAMKKANQQLLSSVRSKDWRKASIASEQARLNYEYARESVKLRKLSDKFNTRLKRLNKAKKPSIAPDYLDNIKVLGKRYGILPTIKLSDPDAVKPFKDLFVSDDVMGDSVEFSDWLSNQFDDRSVTDLTVHEFSELIAAVDYLEHMGRKIAKGGEYKLSYADITFNDALSEMIEPMKVLKSQKIIREDALLRKFSQMKRLYGAGNRMFSFLMRAADGFQRIKTKTAGPNERLVVEPMAVKYNEKITMSLEDQKDLKPFLDHFKERIGNIDKPKELQIGVPIPEKMAQHGRFWTFQRALLIALNMGTSHNRAAVMDGYGLTEQNMEKLLSLFDEADWDMIQNVWDIIDKKWPQLSEVYKRKNGVKPQKVAATSFVTPMGKIMRGGYFPLRFDSLLDSQTQERDELETMRNCSTAAFGPAPFSGMMKSRKATSGGKPPRLDLSVLTQHMEFANTYIAYAEIVSDIDRLIQHPDYRSEFTRVFGTEFYGMQSITGQSTPENSMRNVLKDLVGSNVTQMNALEKKLSWVRGNVTRMFLGVNPSVGLKQAFSLPGYIIDEGKETYKAGLSKVFNNPAQAYKDMMNLSPGMKERAGAFDQNMVDAILSRKTKVMKRIDTVNFGIITCVDALTVTPMWWGKYLKSMKEFDGDVSKSVAAADNSIGFSQPFNRPFDKAPIQRERGLSSLFTMFSSFTLKFGNRQWLYTQGKRNGAVSTREYVKHIALERILPPLMMNLMFSMVWGDPPDEPEEFLEIAGDIALYQVIGLPILRDVVVALASYQRAAVGKGRPKGFETPYTSVIKMVENALKNVFQLFYDSGNPKKQEKVFWSTFELISFTTGVPVSQVAKKFKKSMENIESGNGTIGDYMLIPSYK